MKARHLAIYITLFFISLVIVYFEASVSVETAARVALLTSLNKGTAVLLLDKCFKGDAK